MTERQGIRALEHGNKDLNIVKIQELEHIIERRDKEVELLKAKLKEAEATIEEMHRRIMKTNDDNLVITEQTASSTMAESAQPTMEISPNGSILAL